ncbi:protein involved in biosynthesis of mitomycin antibiotics/polyketide fumonisin [Chthonomonas calidirosea]|uniref:Protein involved in biosynthesis of mitomycin antibiotics/polyketide fumonisin n=1 Tax=Chthonomonas calidirosea (strain DSM 23976 / ICMP 18418 / T49) TaxID=1303518 RepID=S0EXC1_CHTCT|nr:phytanoyl-CoA dioxygenase family protein [Chthonomonas calidirosea]CCW34942.1 Protein involved in biosynthesis of mitomycin antibiotics/polyketide fumonisin [Chthonomonas calidirosea T49]CEK12460.1 protein involved in biosynthesis of mitomycin antibiotics/polyketide fumonisin [Chthonomonas calidirosea]CEK12461.1 protein involved in biosynthesis of mitomycin antibiotics/polyketide fumonisin [Chthonomonas calidirosea]CEK13348.1 protein involved in biosynthesis of mitomycin antibiotics/polyketi
MTANAISTEWRSYWRLTPEQVAQYQRDGYVLFHQPLFSQEKFARLKAIFEENLERYGPDNLDVIHFRDPRLLEFLLSDEVLDLVEPVVGPNIGLWSSHFICKPPYTGKATPWHEDSAYWNGRVSTMAGICTVWLAIDEATPENGCMRVIPGTHNNGFSEYEPVDTAQNIFGSQIRPELIDESKAVYFALQPGECSLHEARLIHGARANTSPKRRAGYTMRYFPTSSKVYPERNQGHKIWLARGVDLAGNRYENA